MRCTNRPATRAAIRIITLASSQPASQQYLPLLYAHAAAMILAFGVLLPLGAFMAHSQKHLVHRLMQPTGTALGLAGLALVVAYVQMTTRAHFRQTVHAVVGVVVLTMTLTTPLLLVRVQWRRWHRGCGHVITCLGIANVLLVRCAIGGTPTTLMGGAHWKMHEIYGGRRGELQAINTYPCPLI